MFIVLMYVYLQRHEIVSRNRILNFKRNVTKLVNAILIAVNQKKSAHYLSPRKVDRFMQR